MHLHEFDTAVSVLRETTVRFPQLVEAWFNLGGFMRSNMTLIIR